MATKEEIKTVLDLFEKNHPERAFNRMGKISMGLIAVLKYLNEFGNGVNSVEISKHLGISSARMTILLKKLETKEMIIKSKSSTDARAVDISLTPKGKVYIDKMKLSMVKAVGSIIDEFGMEEIRLLIEKINRIKYVFNEDVKDMMEVFND